MTVYDWFQLIGGVILALGYLPQIRQLLTSRSCRDLNLKTYVALAAGIGRWKYTANICGCMIQLLCSLQRIRFPLQWYCT